MMELDDFLTCFPDILVVIQDENGKVIYPEDKYLLKYIKDFRTLEDGTLYHDETKCYYKKMYIEHTSNKKKYGITRYLDITKDIKYQNSFEIDETTGVLVKKKLFNVYEDYLRSIVDLKQDFSVVMCDIDHFKQVNDKFGHLAGDDVLRNVADILKSNIRHSVSVYNGIVRPKDYLGRFGGEEFLMILKNINEADTKDKIEMLRTLIEYTDIVCDKDKINVTCSFGSTFVPYDEISYLENVKNKTVEIMNISNRTINLSDQQLYLAKENGRNRSLIRRFSGK